MITDPEVESAKFDWRAEPATRILRGPSDAVSTLETESLPPLACSVRECGKPLSRRDRALVCEAGHSFDLSRSGYANLLQPNDRRSLAAGDSKERVDARIRLAGRGVGRGLSEELARRAAALHTTGWVLDVGCGPGFAIERAAERAKCRSIGLDLSVAAIERGAKRAPNIAWIIANADRRLPFRDRSLACVSSLAGPKNPSEFARVLERKGRAIVAVPAHDDLIELRERLLGEGRSIERADKAIATFAPHFDLVERSEVRERFALDEAGVRDVLDASYRGARRSEAERAQAIDALAVTFSVELLVFAPR